ncbi:efflux RND transporter periplasmic adaptor subunit [Oceanicola sp. S124]|uniref:efflux RND transporter periplasmic adaptor subunit n=1 Tax=Oceanicola sp. S124 TaxID=1042378 RepID=UPI0002558183|nr:efflux RND transporter periplasmic adaptor subunit [Oceanicola sp. S124]
MAVTAFIRGLALVSLGVAGVGVARAEESPLPVHVVTTTIVAPERSYRLTGTIEALDSYPAGFRDGGRVISVAVDVGDVLHEGDEIARVDPARTDASLRAAEASLVAANAALDQAEQAQTRAEGLLARGSGTQAELDQARESYLTARAARDQAEAQLATARRAVEDTVLTVTRDAIVIDRSAEAGQVVGAGQTIVTLASLEGREAVFLTPDDPRLGEALGSDVAIRPLEGDTARIVVPVTEVSPVVAETGTVTAKAQITGEAARGFTIGEPVVGELRLQDAPVISLPWTALNASAGQPSVWILPEGSDRVRLVPVEISAFTRDQVEIASGLEEGVQVVTSGSHALYPDRPVIVLEDAE